MQRYLDEETKKQMQEASFSLQVMGILLIAFHPQLLKWLIDADVNYPTWLRHSFYIAAALSVTNVVFRQKVVRNVLALFMVFGVFAVVYYQGLQLQS